MSRYVYEIPIIVDLGTAVTPVGELLAEVNGMMHSFGFPEALCVESEIRTLVLSSTRALSERELESLRVGVQQQLAGMLTQIAGRVGTPRKLNS